MRILNSFYSTLFGEENLYIPWPLSVFCCKMIYDYSNSNLNIFYLLHEALSLLKIILKSVLYVVVHSVHSLLNKHD